MFAVDRRTKLLTLGAMCFALFMAMLDNTVVNVALPRIQAHLGSGVSGLQWIIDAYTLVFASLMLSGGTLGDIYGRKRFFLIGLSVFTAGSLLCGLAPSLGVLIAGRAVQGLGAAALMPGTLSILTNTFHDPRERAQAIGIWAGVSGLALALGPLVGGALVDRFGWQSVFFLNVPIGILALAVAVLAVRESKHPEGRRLDLPGQLLAIVALGSLTYALIEANNYGWTSSLILGLFAAAALAMAVFLWVEMRSASPMLQLKFFRDPTFAAACTCAALISFGMFGMFFFMSLFFQWVQGYTPFQAGLRTMPATGMVVIVAPLAGRIAGRIGSRLPMALGLALNAAAMCIFTTIDATTSYSRIWPPLLMAGIGMGLVMTPMTAAASARTYGLGLRVPKNAERFPARLAGELTALPASYSLQQYAPYPGDQGTVNSCAAWATAYTAMGVLDNLDHNQGLWDNPLNSLPGGGGSAMYVYSQTCGGGDNGSYIDDDMAIARSQGDDEDSDYSQGEMDWWDAPTAQETANAQNWVLATGYDIGTDQYSIEQAISTNEPVVLGIQVTQAFENNTSGNYPDPNDYYDDDYFSLGGHAVTAVGYDSDGLIVENSWGPRWDNGGFVHISWDWAESTYQNSGGPDLTQAVAMVGMSHYTPAPTLTSLTPTSGPVGTTVTISGTDFTGSTVVAFNGHAALFSVGSATTITATVPPGATSGTIAVTTPGGSATSATSFTVTAVAVPTLTLKLRCLKSGSLKLGKSVTAEGAVTPTSLAGSKVTLTVQEKRGARWVKAKTVSTTITSTGTYSWKYKPAKKDAYRMRRSLAKTATYAAVATKWLTFKVK